MTITLFPDGTALFLLFFFTFHESHEGSTGRSNINRDISAHVHIKVSPYNNVALAEVTCRRRRLFLFSFKLNYNVTLSDGMSYHTA